MRYWKVISLVALIVFSIGTYYVQNALAESKLPDVELQTVHGDVNEIKNLILLASLNNPNIGSYDDVRISSEESIYQSELSYFEKIKGSFRESFIDKLIEENRSFMRGKDGIGGLFGNDELLIHAGPYYLDQNDESFEIEVLDKGSGNTISFQVAIPEKNGQRMNVVDVQLWEDELSVVTRNFHPVAPSEMESGEEFHIYRISLENQALISHETMFETKAANHEERRWTQISEINGNEGIGQEDYFVFRMIYVDESQDFKEPLEQAEYFAYHYETGQLVEMELPEEATSMNMGMNASAYADGSHLYFLNTLENNLQISKYSIDDDEMETIEIQTELDVFGMNTHGMVKDGKMYIPSSSMEGNHLFVVDLESGNVVYEGKLEKDRKLNSAYFDIYDVEIH